MQRTKGIGKLFRNVQRWVVDALGGENEPILYDKFESSIIKQMAFSPENGTLVIWFKDRNGDISGVYRYRNINEDLVEAIAKGALYGSVGKTFYRLLRRKTQLHPYVRLM